MSQRKPPERRQGRGTNDLTLIPGGKQEPPDLPDASKMLKVTRDQWDEFWGSALSAAIERATDMPSVVRYFRLMDERERAYRVVRKEGRTTKGSQDQVVQHPLLKYINSLDSEIRALEDRMGLNPKARLNLGIQYDAVRERLEHMNREMEVDYDDDEILEEVEAEEA